MRSYWTPAETRESLLKTLLWLNAVAERLESTAGHDGSAAPPSPVDSGQAASRQASIPPVLRHPVWSGWDRRTLGRVLRAVDKARKALPAKQWQVAQAAAHQAQQYRWQLQRSWSRRHAEPFRGLAKITVYVAEAAPQHSRVDDHQGAVPSHSSHEPEAAPDQGEVQL
jgi:hypothetical protein